MVILVLAGYLLSTSLSASVPPLWKRTKRLSNQPYNCSVVCKFYDCIRVMEMCTVMVVQKVKEGAQHKPLWGSCADWPALNVLGQSISKSFIQRQMLLFKPRLIILETSLLGMIVLNAELWPTNSRHAHPPCCSKLSSMVEMALSVDMLLYMNIDVGPAALNKSPWTANRILFALALLHIYY